MFIIFSPKHIHSIEMILLGKASKNLEHDGASCSPKTLHCSNNALNAQEEHDQQTPNKCQN